MCFIVIYFCNGKAQFSVVITQCHTCHTNLTSCVQVQARGALQYLVSLLASMEHSAHHTLLLEIRYLTDRYTSILGGGGKDIYRMSNSFSAIARLLGRKLEADSTLSRLTHNFPSYVTCLDFLNSLDMFQYSFFLNHTGD